MNSKFHILIFAGSTSLLLAIYSCKKQNQCVAGSGGSIMATVFPKYNGKPIYNQQDYRDTVYVKFNTQSSPGNKPEDFDLMIAGFVGEDHVHLPHLKCGDYFIYVTGFDTVSDLRVSGGIPVSFTESVGSIDLDVQVTP